MGELRSYVIQLEVSQEETLIIAESFYWRFQCAQWQNCSADNVRAVELIYIITMVT